MRNSEPYDRSESSICWTCQNAVPDDRGHGCSWSDDLTPVPGWKAEPSENLHGLYRVKECPLYRQDGEPEPEPGPKPVKGGRPAEEDWALAYWLRDGM